MVQVIYIREPIWRTKSVGVAETAIHSDDILVEITYTKKDGTRAFPGKYYMASPKARQYPTMNIGPRLLYIIPISDFERVADPIREQLSKCCQAAMSVKFDDNFMSRILCKKCGQETEYDSPGDPNDSQQESEPDSEIERGTQGDLFGTE